MAEKDKGKKISQADRTKGAEYGGSSTAAGIGVMNKMGSSAQGPYQILDGTWKEMEKIAGKKLDRKSVEDNDLAFGLYTKRSEKALEQNGIEVNPGNTYALHVFGPTGGVQYLKRMNSNPEGLSTDGMSSAVINGNKAFFYDKEGKPRTNRDSYGTLSARVGGKSDPGAMSAAKDQQKMQYAQQKQAELQMQAQEQEQSQQEEELAQQEQSQEQAPEEQSQQPQQTSALSQASNSSGLMYNGDRSNPGKFILPEQPQAPEGVATSGDAAMKAKTFAYGGGIDPKIDPRLSSGMVRDTVKPRSRNLKEEYLARRAAVQAQNEARLAPIRAQNEARINDWISGNPGTSVDDYWKWQEKRQKGPEAGLDGLNSMGKADSKGSCAPGVNKKKADAAKGVNYAYGGEIDPTKEVVITPNASSAIIKRTGIGAANESGTPAFNTKQIVYHQPGVTDGKTGKSSTYLFSRKPTDPNFNYKTDRETVYNENLRDVYRTPEWKSYQSSMEKTPVVAQTQGRNVAGFADGGEMDNGLLNDFNEGGSHEENPNGGIEQGMSPDGAMNTVEEGETKMGQYVFSDRLKLDKGDVDNLYLPKETIGMTYADASKFINEFLEDNPFDIIIKRTATGQLDSLKIGNDRARRYKEQEEQIVDGTDMDPENMMKFSQSKEQEGNPGQEEVHRNPEVEAQEPGSTEGQQFSYGGRMNKFANGGNPLFSGEGALSKENAGATIGKGIGVATTGMQMGMEAFKKHDSNDLDERIGRVAKGGALAGGAMKGAAAGATFGPWGAAAGAVVGGALGFIGASRQNKAANLQDMNISGNDYNKQWGANARDVEDNYAVNAAYGGKQRRFDKGGEGTIGDDEASSALARQYRLSKLAMNSQAPSSRQGMSFNSNRWASNVPESLGDYKFTGNKNANDPGTFDYSKASKNFADSTANDAKYMKNSSALSSYGYTAEDKKTPFKMKGSSPLAYAGAAGALANFIQSRREKPRVIKSEELSKYSSPNYYDEAIIDNKMNQEMNNRQQMALSTSGGSAAAARAMSMAGNSDVNKLKSDSYFKMFEVNDGIRNRDQAEIQRIQDSNVVGRNNDYQSNLAEQDYVQGRREKARDNMFSSVESIGQEQNDRNLIYNMSKGYHSDGTYDPEGNKDAWSRATSFIGRNRAKANGGLLDLYNKSQEKSQEQQQLDYIKSKYNG